ncbi:hypothetical protein F3I62_13615 [Pseudomonas sp. R-28-1W-6]|uniref:glycosyltransferase family 52 n=1 Tax=Pseudomonas sp. R-28-1W-6 TaxID=2650101 RepID=UPI001365E2E5|nr:glycosyltransferase family 52 [Pseudomonas sp. R-28-1W-6]MWV13139.1 hypothetical protein [Pseudomonas sp. R-28-1W-6]
MRTIALPETVYHIELIKENHPEVDLYLIRRNSAPYEKNLPLGANFSFFEADQFSLNPISSIRRARALYKNLSRLISESGAGNLIIFADAKPYHKYIIDYCLKNGIEVELWEDGLGYYIGTGHKYKSIAKNFIKVAFGAYHKGLLSEQHRRDEIVTRDRFIQKNLRYPVQEPAFVEALDRIAFIGQPLVDDGYLSASRYVSIIESIYDQSGIMVDYLPHPREQSLIFNQSKVRVVKGVKTQSYLCTVKYLHCTTAFSTAIINLSGESRSFCPGLFGLRQVERALSKFPELGVRVVKDFSSIGQPGR